MKNGLNKNKKTYFFDKFINTNIDKIAQSYQSQTDAYWKKQGQKMAFTLFHEMSIRVPAYRNFLEKHKIDPQKIKTFSDLSQVPYMDKPSYMEKYRLNDLCWDGKIENSYMLSTSSGTTGIPYFWPRSDEQTYQGALLSEVFYKYVFEMDKKPTLVIIAFGMGTWIAGIYMMMATHWVNQKGYPVTVTTPGLNKEEILRLVKFGSLYYDQIVLMGLPPFIKDVIDTGIVQGFDWKKANIKFMFGAEAFTERWRNHIQAKVGFKNYYTSISNIYGTADVGVNAYETPTSIYIRRLSADNLKIRQDLFQDERVPSLNQFDPTLRYFEQVGEELTISAHSGVPLLRYNLKDIGNVLYFEDVAHRLKNYGTDIVANFKKMKLNHLLWHLPLVYLFGRGKFSATIYGIVICPEYVKHILDNHHLEKFCTGKFIITTEETQTHDQQLLLKVELKDRVEPDESLNRLVINTFVDELPKICSEYRHLLASIKHKAHPMIKFYEYGNPTYFPRGIVKKTS